MSLRLKWQCTPRRSRFLIATTLTTIIGGLVTSAVIAAVSFQGQGTIKFDRVSTKKLTVSQEAQFLDSVKNPTPGKPVKISDSLKVTGTADFFGVLKNTTPGKPVKIDDGFRVTGASEFLGSLMNPTSGQPLKVQDSMKVTGDMDVDGSLSAGNVSAIEANVALNRSELINIGNYLWCVVDLSQYTTYSESDDIGYCWNTYMAGTSILPPLAKQDQDGTKPSDVVVPPTGTRPSLNRK